MQDEVFSLNMAIKYVWSS